MLFITSAVIFVIFYALPVGRSGGAAGGPAGDPGQIAQIREDLGLDKPIYEQYWIYMKNLVLHFDFGYSYEFDVPVREHDLRPAAGDDLPSVGAMSSGWSSGSRQGSSPRSRAVGRWTAR